MNQIIINPTTENINTFRERMYKDTKVVFVTDNDLKQVNSRFIKPNEFVERSRDYNHVIKFVKLDTATKNFLYQLQKPCVDTRFLAYHIGNYGVILDKKKGNIICLIEDDDINIIGFDDSKVLIKLYGNDNVVILRTSENTFSMNSAPDTDRMEKPVKQDLEWARLHDPKEGLINWDVWVCEFLRAHNE